MTDPYSFLGNELAAAAERRGASRNRRPAARAWLARRLHGPATALAVLLAGGAVAAAASGVLDGTPVRPEGPLRANAGAGVPVAGGAGRLALIAEDPGGGPPWGLRIIRTTRGETCVQVGRVQNGQLGELGLDSAFGNDGRFHELSTDILPPGYGAGAGQIECGLNGRTFIVEDDNADRSGQRLLPGEFPEPPTAHHRRVPPTSDLRTLAYGLLGAHTVSITYRTPTGLLTTPVAGPDGAFLIVQPGGFLKSPDLVGGTIEGGAIPAVFPGAPRGRPRSIIAAVTVRIGEQLCSEGSGAPVQTPCPLPRPTLPRHAYRPTRDLHAPVRLTLLPQSRPACRAAFLNYPCYKGQVQFTAPYAIRAAGTDYLIEGVAKCSVGGRPETGWALERDVKADETVRTDSLGLFVVTPSCASSEAFRVEYVNPEGRSAQAPHESVVVGTVALSKAVLPGGTPIDQNARPSG